MPSMAPFSRSSKKARLRPTIAANVKVTHRAPGATSNELTAVGSRAKKRIDRTSIANTMADKKAVLVRHSTIASLAMIAQTTLA